MTTSQFHSFSSYLSSTLRKDDTIPGFHVSIVMTIPLKPSFCHKSMVSRYTIRAHLPEMRCSTSLVRILSLKHKGLKRPVKASWGCPWPRQSGRAHVKTLLITMPPTAARVSHSFVISTKGVEKNQAWRKSGNVFKEENLEDIAHLRLLGQLEMRGPESRQEGGGGSFELMAVEGGGECLWGLEITRLKRLLGYPENGKAKDHNEKRQEAHGASSLGSGQNQ